VYDTTGWPEDDYASVLEQLEQRSVRFELEGDDLVVDVRHEQMVDTLVSEFDVVEAVPPRVAYSTEYWSPAQFATVTGQLTELGIEHFFDDGELIVDKDDEAAVDRVLGIPDDPPAGERVAKWRTDPTVRNQLRDSDGHGWTRRVANQGQTSVDPFD
jgi:hypothetical protein